MWQVSTKEEFRIKKLLKISTGTLDGQAFLSYRLQPFPPFHTQTTTIKSAVLLMLESVKCGKRAAC